jgi:exodeoxyribonuclease VII large subunit
LYEERGNFQLKVERIESSGIGDMAKAFAQLKVKLEALGYFSQEKKQALPAVINSLAIVTSQTSAAITDVLNVIKRRNPLLDVKIYHASVQGERAIEEIIDALLTADINHHDVILLTRGGGSTEDLWTFNDISIAQTLFNLQTPCVSAIGHERDSVISDLVADAVAITPTAAAELLTPDLSELKLRLSHNLQNLHKLIHTQLNSHKQQLDISFHKLEKSHPQRAIQTQAQWLKNTTGKLQQLFKQNRLSKLNKLNLLHNNLLHYDFKLTERRNRLTYLKNTLETSTTNSYHKKLNQLQSFSLSLNTLSPLATLSRGYSITLNQSTNKLITDGGELKEGDKIETQFKKGSIVSQVIE